MVGLDKPLARIWASSLRCGSAKQAFCPNVRLKAWHGGARLLDKPLARIWVSSLTCRSAKQAFCPNVKLKVWHGGARQTFGPNLGFKFDMRERKTSVLPQCKVAGLAWHGGARQTFDVRLKAWHGGARQTFGPNLGFKFDMRERKTSVVPQCKVEGLAWWG